jgi:hypothetical protein
MDDESPDVTHPFGTASEMDEWSVSKGGHGKDYQRFLP